jgi:dolichol kinase
MVNLVDAEEMVLLFPLHQALLSLLHSFTTTSLLPAELQLLSIALINLLLFSSSPYAVILWTLLWIGGLGVYLSCGHVIRWGIALARIPRWRLRRATQSTSVGSKFLKFFEWSWYNFHHLTRNESTVDSDADDDQDHLRPRPSLRIDALKAELLTSLRTSSLFADDPETKSAIEPSSTNPTLEMPMNGYVSRKRRYTMPNFQGSTQFHQKPKLKRRRKTFVGSLSQSFLNLTPIQATITKWLYAGYVYLTMLVLVLGPIRIVIERYALDNSEPFCWVIGYLFGDVPRVRSWVHLFKLESWIPLPAQSNSQQQLGHAEYIRQMVVGESNTRLLICGYCIIILALGMATVLHLSTVVEVDTRRKVFHGMMVAILVPSIYIDPAFIALALGLVLAGFLILELLRASQLPPLSKPLAYFLTPYVDGRDLRGPVVVSHIFLLIGCAVPLWLSLADAVLAGKRPWRGWEVRERDVSMVSGVVCVGLGDAAASLIGRRYGRRKWPWAGGKSLEGSAAFALAVAVGLSLGKFWLWFGQWDDRHYVPLDRPAGMSGTLGKAVVGACLASLMEAVLTGGNDNVIVPILLWLVVRALDM